MSRSSLNTVRMLVAAVLLVAGVTVALWRLRIEYGNDIIIAYILSFMFTLSVGWLTLRGAAEIAPKAWTGGWPAALALAAGYAVFDGLNVFFNLLAPLGIAIIAPATLAALAVLFLIRSPRGLLLILLLFMLKLVTTMVLQATLYTWFIE